MFAFSHGSYVRTIDLGPSGTYECPVCDRSRPFHLVLVYQTNEIYGVLRFAGRRQYFELCTACQQGWDLDVKDTEARLGNPPIPSSDRSGPVVALLLVGLVVLGMMILALV